MMWKMTGIVLLLLAVLLINLMLWRFAMPVYVNRRISRFQNELVNRHYDEVETMYRTMRGAAARGGRFLSDKQGNHGFGLLRIDDIVAKHGGYLNRKTEEGVFATEVMLPMEHI